jgi:hypothetical protein
MRNILLIAGAVTLTGTAVVVHPGHEDQLASAVKEVERINALRDSLAEKLLSVQSPDQAMFQEVCGPVATEAKRLGDANGWKVEQLAEKYRNPVHRADREAERYMHFLTADTTVEGLWIRTVMDGKPGMRYFRRIVVRKACMPCHGTMESRPEFIKTGYPRDRAYNFKIGDLRGVYSVFIPDAP